MGLVTPPSLADGSPADVATWNVTSVLPCPAIHPCGELAAARENKFRSSVLLREVSALRHSLPVSLLWVVSRVRSHAVCSAGERAASKAAASFAGLIDS